MRAPRAAGQPRRSRGGVSAPEPARAPFGRRLLTVVRARELGAYRLLRVADPTARARSRASSRCSPRAERWGGGEDERPFLPRAFSVARAPARGESQFLLEDVGPGTRRLCELRAGRRLWLARAARARLHRAAGGAPADPRRRRRRDRAAGDPAGHAGRAACRRALLGFRDGAHAAGAALLARRAASRPTTARSGTTGSSPSCSSASSTRDPDAVVYACGPPAMLEAVSASCERARRARPAGARGGRWPAASAPASAAWCRDAAAATCASASTGRCSTLPSSTTSTPTPERPRERRVLRAGAARTRSSTARAPSTRSPPGASSASALREAFPFAAYVSKTITLRAARGQPAAAAVGGRRAGLINSIGLPNKGLEGYCARTSSS